MSKVDISFYNSVYINAHPFFCNKESVRKEIFLRMINISEKVFSLPLTRSYLEQPWQFTIEREKSFFYTAIYFLFWSLFTHVTLYQRKTWSIFFLPICAIPKIYNRYSKQNYLNTKLSEYQAPLDRMLEIINTKSDSKITDFGLIHLIKYYIKLKDPESAKQIYERKWEIGNKQTSCSKIISCYLELQNPEAAEKCLVAYHEKSKAHILGLDLMLIFQYYLKVKQPEKARSLLDRLPSDASAFHFHNALMSDLVEYFLDEKEPDKAISIISNMSESPKTIHKEMAQIDLAYFFLINGDRAKANEWIAKVEGKTKDDTPSYHLEKYLLKYYEKKTNILTNESPEVYKSIRNYIVIAR